MQTLSWPDWIKPDLLGVYDLELDQSFIPLPLLGGLQHEVWKVQTNGGFIVLKRQLRQPDTVALALEHAAGQDSIACPKLIQTTNGDLLVTQEYQGTQYFIRAYEYIDGQTLGRDPLDDSLAFMVGQQLAELHASSKRRLHNELKVALRSPIADYYEIEVLNKTTRLQIKRFTTDFNISGRPAIIGHRDISGKNIIIQNYTAQPYFIDFDEAGLATIDGEIIDAAFNLAGVHTPKGPRKEIVQSFVAGYRTKSTHPITFDELSFHILIGLSEYWWLGVCLNRIKDGRVSADKLEKQEVTRLTRQLPSDLQMLDSWLGWLA